MKGHRTGRPHGAEHLLGFSTSATEAHLVPPFRGTSHTPRPFGVARAALSSVASRGVQDIEDALADVDVSMGQSH
jgi:hypothetical protein